MKQLFTITHQHTVLWERKKLDQSSTDEHLTMISFYEYIRTSNFSCGYNILIEDVFVVHPVMQESLKNCVGYNRFLFKDV
jgi:hypothetical protein